jgi:N-methylhydantoinase A
MSDRTAAVGSDPTIRELDALQREPGAVLMPKEMLRVAVDTGGTFTDCVYLRDGKLHTLKLPSTPGDPSQAVLEAVSRISAGETPDVRHGTTVPTNAMLERKGARVAFVTTAGFDDTIAIGRQTRAELYNWFAPAQECLVPQELRFGVPERVSAEGTILRAPTDAELDALVSAVRESGAEAVALSLLFSFANAENEERVAAALSVLGLPVSVSHRILPEFREYERASTIVVNAYLAPRMQSYLLRLEERLAENYRGSRVRVMQSSGGIISAQLAAREPVRTVLSGPAGGVIGACRMAQIAGLGGDTYQKIIGIDMGGTSTDVFVAEDVRGPKLTRESKIAGVPVSVPMLDIHTVGAGGGSIARWDAGGLLHVGPESAGAHPGPACFGRGELPTVTDANLVLGRLDTGSFLGGSVSVDKGRARKVLEEHRGSLKSVEEFAAGILRVVETRMESALRVISVERGLDPQEFTLVAFGGGGPLHACALARALRIPRVLIPPAPGALSAVGILLADTVRDYSRTVMLSGDFLQEVLPVFAELEMRGRMEFEAEGLSGMAECSVDIRYQRQGYELNVPFDCDAPHASVAAFHRQHAQLYGFSHPERAVEIVNVRLRMRAAGEDWKPSRSEKVRGDGHAAWMGERDVYFDDGLASTQLYGRDALRAGDVVKGPAMIVEYTSATLLSAGWVAEMDAFGNLVIEMQHKIASGEGA